MSTSRKWQQELIDVLSHVGFPTSSIDRRQIDDRQNEKLKGLGRLPKGDNFSTFNSEHMAEAKEFYDVLSEARDFDEFLNLAFTARDILNEGLFVFGVSWAVLDCSVCQGLLVPPIHEIFPAKFVPSVTIARAVKRYLDRENDNPITVTVDTTGSPQDEENRVAYFREDVGLNTHHWHWHLVYPTNGRSKDRKGELFYYMHQQMCARYDCERLSVGLRLVEPLYNFDDQLMGYAPHLFSLDSGRSNASRPDGMSIKETNHLNRWRERIMEAIHQGYLVDKSGERIPLDADKGIDLLGAVVEASDDSKNRSLYGNLHNMLHRSIMSIHDPKGKFEQLPGVIGDSSTAVRDPAFFRLHRYIDDLFTEHKITLPSYTAQQLNFPGVRVTEVKLESKEPNVISTYMKKATMELNHAIRMKISVKVEYEHLDHDPFIYAIKVTNTARINKEATVRIFMAPKGDEVGIDFPLNTQRRFFIEMDKFRVTLTSGENTIRRSSSESFVTVKHIPSFQELKEKSVVQDKQGRAITDPYCSCGWPQYLMIPRGTYRGMDFKLFVMLTDNKEDSAESVVSPSKCNEAISYCGLKDQKYPDKKAMGFPFDRKITDSTTIIQFATPNMSFTDIKVQFTGLKLLLQSPSAKQ